MSEEGLDGGKHVLINQTDEHLTAEIEVREDGNVLVEQRVSLPGWSPKSGRTHSSVWTQVSVANISEGTALTTEIFVDDHRAEAVDFTADCDTDDRWTGDEVTFYIQADSIDAQTGRCTTEELPQ